MQAVPFPSPASDLSQSAGESVLLGFRLAVNASVCARLRVGELKDVRELLLRRCDASGILAFDEIRDFLRKLDVLLSDDLIVLDDINGDIGVDEP